MGRISNKYPRKATVIADPGVTGRVPRAKAMRVNVVSAPTDATAFLGNVAPLQIIEETDVANALENEPVNIYIDDTAPASNLIPNAEPTRVYVSSGSLATALWHDEFYEASDTELELHEVSPIAVTPSTTWSRVDISATTSLKATPSSVCQQGADTFGAYVSYVLPLSAHPTKISCTMWNTNVSGSTGLIYRMNSLQTNGRYVQVGQSGANIVATIYDWATASVLATQSIGAGDLTAQTSYILEDDETTVNFYQASDYANRLTYVSTTYGIYDRAGLVTDVAASTITARWKDFKVLS